MKSDEVHFCIDCKKKEFRPDWDGVGQWNMCPYLKDFRLHTCEEYEPD